MSLSPGVSSACPDQMDYRNNLYLFLNEQIEVRENRETLEKMERRYRSGIPNWELPSYYLPNTSEILLLIPEHVIGQCYKQSITLRLKATFQRFINKAHFKSYIHHDLINIDS